MQALSAVKARGTNPPEGKRRHQTFGSGVAEHLHRACTLQGPSMLSWPASMNLPSYSSPPTHSTKPGSSGWSVTSGSHTGSYSRGDCGPKFCLDGFPEGNKHPVMPHPDPEELSYSQDWLAEGEGNCFPVQRSKTGIPRGLGHRSIAGNATRGAPETPMATAPSRVLPWQLPSNGSHVQTPKTCKVSRTLQALRCTSRCCPRLAAPETPAASHPLLAANPNRVNTPAEQRRLHRKRCCPGGAQGQDGS